ncbi:MAG: NAD(P)H-binding protein [Candidatus Acidiferrales bacterium]
MPQRAALIAGATGLVGALCLKQLLDDPAYAQVTAIVRRPTGHSHPKLAKKIVDFDALGRLAPIAADDAFCALGTTNKKAGSQEAYRRIDAGYAKSFAEFALAGGAKQFALVSSVGADAGSRYFYLRTKGELEDAVNALPFAAVHIFRPSFILGVRAEQRAGEGIGIRLAKVLQYALVGRLSEYRPIAASTIAAAMVAAVKKAEPGRHIYHFAEMQSLATQH